MGQTQTTKSKIRIETAFDLSYLQSGDRNVDLKQISQRRGLSKTKWFPECIEYASDERRLYVLASDHVISITRSDIRIDPDKRSVHILESISCKSLRSPLNGTFAVGKKNSLVAFIPSESCDRVIRFKFSSMNTPHDLDTRRRRIILEFAIVLERHHVCKREVLVHILNFSPRIGLCQNMSSDSEENTTTTSMNSSTTSPTAFLRKAIAKLSPRSLLRRRRKNFS